MRMREPFKIENMGKNAYVEAPFKIVDFVVTVWGSCNFYNVLKPSVQTYLKKGLEIMVLTYG